MAIAPAPAPAPSPTLEPSSLGTLESAEFVSDLHLCEEAPLTTATFEAWLANTQAQALFILGDLFEVWIGDDTAERPFAQRCLAALKQAASRRPVYFIHGNRDFLLGAEAMRRGGLQPLPDPFCLQLQGQRLLLSHGDALCLADEPYQRFRRMVRSPQWQSQFLAMPLAEREAIAQRIRAESQGRKAAQPDLSQWADADTDESRRWLLTHDAQVLLHGHTHRPAVHALGHGLQRRVLPDWDLDGLQPRGFVTRRDADGWHQLPLAGPAR